jgi:hypothetical protein
LQVCDRQQIPGGGRARVCQRGAIQGGDGRVEIVTLESDLSEEVESARVLRVIFDDLVKGALGVGRFARAVFCDASIVNGDGFGLRRLASRRGCEQRERVIEFFRQEVGVRERVEREGVFLPGGALQIQSFLQVAGGLRVLLQVHLGKAGDFPPL